MAEAASGIANLIAKIKADGVEAGESERRARLAAAQREAEQIVAQAHAQAERIVAQARSDADRRREQLESELRMAARDFVLRLQQRLSEQVIEPSTSALIQGALADDQGVSQLILDMLRGRIDGARLTLNSERRQTLQAAILSRIAAQAQAEGIEITDESGLGGFRLTRPGEHFVWDVSQDAVARELASLVEPSLRSALVPKPSQG